MDIENKLLNTLSDTEAEHVSDPLVADAFVRLIHSMDKIKEDNGIHEGMSRDKDGFIVHAYIEILPNGKGEEAFVGSGLEQHEFEEFG